ncbi:MAG: hypothetical protein HGA85_00290 [Nanoarchaeota archaeon]|nr:hypothetical protein [Nanoarchaeota archaeon]
MAQIPRLIILAAGKATRYQTQGSQYLIKSLAEVGPDRERLIEYILYDWYSAKGKEVTIVVNRDTIPEFKRALCAWDSRLSISYALQEILPGEDRPRGTVNALLAGIDFSKRADYISCNGDDIYGQEAFSLLISMPKKGHFATLGYMIGDCVRDNESKGVSRAVLSWDKAFRLISCTQYDRLGKDGCSIKDLDSGKIIDGTSGSSMNIFYVDLVAAKKIKEIESKIPYLDHSLMIKRYGRQEYLLPSLLSDIAASKKLICKVMPFKIRIPFGLTRQEDLETVKSNIKEHYTHIW